MNRTSHQTGVNKVLIESDWNLKKKDYYIAAIHEGSINRIRLEFKVIRPETPRDDIREY